MFSERQAQTKHLVEAATTLLDHYAQAARDGILSEDAAKKLRRQSQLLEGALFEGDEVGGRVPAEAGAQDPGVVALFQAGSGFAPFDRIDRRQVLGADWGEAGQRRGEDADGAAHDQAW
jgi:hypothetical protein